MGLTIAVATLYILPICDLRSRPTTLIQATLSLPCNSRWVSQTWQMDEQYLLIKQTITKLCIKLSWSLPRRLQCSKERYVVKWSGMWWTDVHWPTKDITELLTDLCQISGFHNMFTWVAQCNVNSHDKFKYNIQDLSLREFHCKETQCRRKISTFLSMK